MRHALGIGVFLTVFQLTSGPAQAGVLRQDLRALFTPRNLGLSALGFGLAGVTHVWDDDARRRLKGAAPFAQTARVTDVYGASEFELPATLGLYLFARAARRGELRAVSSDLLRALVFTQGVVGPIKYGARRWRPDRSNRLSFPSGHAANAFTVAGVLARRYGPRVGVPLYLVGIFVAAGRIEGDHHFLSDVIAGAALGTVVGVSVTRTEAKRISVLPGRTPDGWTLILRFCP
ncbi:MAG: phosphatase PAP2 family protein [Candidatus Latescibacteria bacterium]|nr:phosphatase PAP2 family protein [Candidatus Latescibacterota bacterium]